MPFEWFEAKLRRVRNPLGKRPWISRYVAAMLSGLLLACAFPRMGIAGFAWVAPGALMAAALGIKGAEAFRVGYVGGLTYYLAGLYWLLFIPFRWHGIPIGPAGGWIALAAYLALYPAVWVWGCCWFAACGAKAAAGVLSPNDAAHGSTSGTSIATKWAESLPDRWMGRAFWSISSAALWVALEMILTRLFSGFPWDLLGVSQYEMTPLIQVASITGVYGVSFLIIWVSLSLLAGAGMLLRRPTARSIWLLEIFVPILVVAALFNFGLRQLRKAPATGRMLKVTLVQPSIPQTLIWNPENDEARFRDLIQVSEQALTNQTDLLLWPESGIPKLLRYDQEILEAVTGLARKHQVWMIVGADDTELKADGKTREFYNSSFLIGPDGRLMDGYRKRSLVIFGEYIPLVRWLPFMKFFTPIPGGFTPGDRPTQFKLSTIPATISPLICFEDVFPQLGREAAGPDTDFLVNLTNDGWFGESAEPWQHAATAVFRAVENRRPLVRCTNTGVTCWIDAHGQVREVLRDPRGTVYGPGILCVKIPLARGDEALSPTFYNRHGDVFGWGCVAFAGCLALFKVMSGWLERRAARPA